MSDWYYWVKNKEFGPVSKLQLYSLYKNRVIANYSFVRTEESEDWIAYKELKIRKSDFSWEELNGPDANVEKLLQVENEEATVPDLEQKSPGVWKNQSPHPWRRNFARWVDILIYSNLFIILSNYFIDLQWLQNFTQALSSMSFILLAVLCYGILFSLTAVLNTILMTLFRTTIGKFIFGIRVLDENQNPLSLARNFKRELLVLIKGLAFGIPVITLITQVYGYIDLTMDKVTKWDKQLNTTIVHRDNNTVQLFLGVFGLILYFLIPYGFKLPFVIPI